MKTTKQVIRSLVRHLSIERIAIILSVCYLVGVILLLQYNAIFVGTLDFDFVRIKPIIVGIEYFIYLSIPIVVILLPVILISNRCFSRFWSWFYCRKKGRISKRWRVGGLLLRLVIYILGVAVMAFLFGLMFHYFLPYTEYFLPDGDKLPDNGLWSLIMIACSFWRIYFCWDLCLIAFLCLFIVASLWALKYCNICCFKTSASKRFYNMVLMILLPLGFLTNMFYFVRDVYPNISQAACGGAPVCGLITIVNPGELLRHDIYGGECECDEVTKFCGVMQGSDDFWFIDEHVISGSVLGDSVKLRVKPTRVRKTDIKQFTPLKIPVFYHKGVRESFHQGNWYDFVHNVDFVAEFSFSANDVAQCMREIFSFNTTNSVELLLIADNLPAVRLNAVKQSITKESLTNVSYRVEFQHLPISNVMVVPEFMNAVTNTVNGFNCKLRNLPKVSPDLHGTSMSLGFVINYNLFLTIVQRDMADVQRDMADVQRDMADVQRDMADVQRDMAEHNNCITISHNELQKHNNEDGEFGFKEVLHVGNESRKKEAEGNHAER